MEGRARTKSCGGTDDGGNPKTREKREKKRMSRMGKKLNKI